MRGDEAVLLRPLEVAQVPLGAIPPGTWSVEEDTMCRDCKGKEKISLKI